MTSLRDIARVLVLIGGILALVLGILSLVGYGIGRIGRFAYFSFGLGPIFEIVAGILAIALYRQLGNLGVIIALLIFGVVAGGMGGILSDRSDPGARREICAVLMKILHVSNPGRVPAILERHFPGLSLDRNDSIGVTHFLPPSGEGQIIEGHEWGKTVLLPPPLVPPALYSDVSHK